LAVFEFLDFAVTGEHEFRRTEACRFLFAGAVAADACGRLWIQGLAAERRAIGKVKK